MSHDPDSENVDRLWFDRPQPSGDANIYTLLMVFYPTDEFARFCD